MSYLLQHPITVIVMVICIGNFLRINMQGNSKEENAVQLGAFFRPAIENRQWYRFLTVGFTHIQIWHIFMNLYALYAMSWLEPYFGEVWFAVILFGSVIAGSFVQYKFSNTVLAVGLSGGLYGLITAEAIIFLSLGMFSNTAYLYSFLRVLIINLIMNFLPGIGWQAHLGGAVFGVLCAVIMILL